MPWLSAPSKQPLEPRPNGKPEALHKVPPNALDALKHFESPGVRPPSSRVTEAIQKESKPLRLWDLWKFGTFAAARAAAITADIVSHQIRGPRRKSWGIEMTILNGITRGVSQYSHLVDVGMIRMLMGLGGLVPLPADALVTPVTFKVRRRHLRGMLAEYDAVETGSRELSGEWVVGKRTWQRLQAEWKAQKRAKSTSGEKLSLPKRRNERVILYVHGGAYYTCSPATHRMVTIPLAKYLDARLFAVNYRLAPETRFPGPMHDVVMAYFRLIDELHIPPENIIIAGDSAGGGLAVGTLMYLRDNDYPLPSGVVLLSPWVDLTMSCESWDSNAQYDIIPTPLPDGPMNPIVSYLGENMGKYITHPYASPLFGDFKGLPPMLIQAGECEVLRDEISLLAHKAALAGVEVRHEIYEDAIHVFQSLPFFEASRQAYTSCADFVHNFLPQYQARSPKSLEGSAEQSLEDEIDNDATLVVRGDGTETSADPDSIPSAGEETGRLPYARKTDPQSPSPILGPDEDPSWGKQWVSPSDSEEDDGDFESITKPVSMHDSSTLPPERPRLNRLRTTLSLIAGAASHSAADHLHPPSTQSVPHTPLDPPPPPPPVPSSPRRKRMSSISMTASNEVPPTPTIRRSRRSHPDISSLCQQFATTGPANHTLTFKPDDQHKRRHSRTPSAYSVVQ